MDTQNARRIAAQWHDGQWSALYAFSSAETLDVLACLRELDGCAADSLLDACQLTELTRYFQARQDFS